MSVTAYSVYYQLPSIYGDHPLHRNLRVGHTLMTRKHLIQLMIYSNYHDNFYCRLVNFVALTELLKNFAPLPDLTALINVLLSLSVIDLVLILGLLLTSL
jgi:hypothetical protein